MDFRTDLPTTIKPSLMTLIDPRTSEFARGVGDKHAMINAAPGTRSLILVWTGQWGSDAFTLTAAQAKKLMA